MRSTLSKIISIDEMKVSVLVITLIFSMSVGTYSIIFKGDIPPNLANIIICMILSISGVNAMTYFGKSSTSNNQYTEASSVSDDLTTQKSI